ncbi:maleylpyruvate isomerase N-terminal domain-containing protein [Streptomyces sp. NBC_01538]|uniref:maleylpyruvate isomerase N-terminal domain-containing protein n=1 Tax=Streptomyces sp. NBC_01538 TaxID=2903897 RepID=UPI00386DC33D
MNKIRDEISYEQLCAGLESEARLLAGILRDVGPEEPVGTCPGWTTSHLMAHLFQAFTWAAGMVETRAKEFLPPHLFVAGGDEERWATHGGTWPEYVNDLIKVSFDEVAEFDGGEARARWVLAAADSLVVALRDAGADGDVWNSVGADGTRFWASWGALETMVHRADTELLLGRAPDALRLRSDLSVESVQLWLQMITAPGAEAFFGPRLAAMAGEGESLRFRATDVADVAEAEWLLLRTPEGPALAAEDDDRRAGTTVSGRAGDLLMLLKRRVPMKQAAVDITGDARLLEHWLANVMA